MATFNAVASGTLAMADGDRLSGGAGPVALTAEPLLEEARVCHGFFTRLGGVSEGLYASLNCGLGSGDQRERVQENRRRAAAHLGTAGAGHLVTAIQVHSADVAVVDRPWPLSERPQADGLVTRTPGVAIGVLTADCAPVLLADGDAGVVGAAHAGWRGAKAGIVAATIQAMTREGARVERIVAAVGPCIGPVSYEVGPEFHAAFIAEAPETAKLFRPANRPGHHRFDLASYVAGQLRAAGVRSLAVIPCDTCGDSARFFSYRRVARAGGGDYGRQLSAIMLA